MLPNDGLRNYVLNFLNKPKEVENFKVELANGEKDIAVPKNFRMVNYGAELSSEFKRGGGAGGGSSADNIFKVQLNFRIPVRDYSCLVMLRNNELTDVRVYEFIITINPRPFKAELEFNTNARLPIT